MQKERQIKLNSLIPKNWNLLDLWCARWHISDFLREDVEYYGVEYNDAMVQDGIKKWRDIRKCDLSSERIPFEDNMFDVIFCSHVIEHFYIQEQIQIFLECSRVLKKWGKILFYMPTGYHWSFFDDETHKKWHSHISLRALAKDTWFHAEECRYSLTRKFPDHWQGRFRLPPLPWYLTEVYVVATNEKKLSFSKEY